MGNVVGFELAEALENGAVAEALGADAVAIAEVAADIAPFAVIAGSSMPSLPERPLLRPSAEEVDEVQTFKSTSTAECESVETNVASGPAKMNKLIKKYFAIDAIFKTAMEIVHTHEGNSLRFHQLDSYVHVLKEMEEIMSAKSNWIANSQKQTFAFDGIKVSEDLIQWTNDMRTIGTGMGKLQKIANDVKVQNGQKRPISDEQLEVFKEGLVKLNTTLESIALYMGEKKIKSKELALFPISTKQVNQWKAVLGK